MNWEVAIAFFAGAVWGRFSWEAIKYFRRWYEHRKHPNRLTFRTSDREYTIVTFKNREDWDKASRLHHD